MKARECRVCHCTEDDCRGCVERSGEHCHWVETGLCSACTGVSLIAQERDRGRCEEGFTSEHDDKHLAGELAMAAVCYALPSHVRESAPIGQKSNYYLRFWPWEAEWWRPAPSDRVGELVKAGALIASEIDRLNRLPIKRRVKGGAS